MPDGDRRKTMKLSKGGNKPAASGGTPAETRKHDDLPPPAQPKSPPPAAQPSPPSGGGDNAKTQVFRAGEAGAAAEPTPAQQAQKPAAAAPPASDDNTKTQVFRPGSKTESEAGPMKDDPPGAVEPQAESKRVSNPVVGWLVVVSGPGAGGYRGIFDGRNRIGRTGEADIPIDFGDPGISKEQAIIHYDPKDRKFLFIPQLDVENFTYINQEKPTAPLELKALDEIEMAATTLRFVPLCGPKFDWSDLDKK